MKKYLGYFLAFSLFLISGGYCQAQETTEVQTENVAAPVKIQSPQKPNMGRPMPPPPPEGFVEEFDDECAECDDMPPPEEGFSDEDEPDMPPPPPPPPPPPGRTIPFPP